VKPILVHKAGQPKSAYARLYWCCLEWMSPQQRLDVIADPECEAEKWWEVAAYCPLAAQASALYPLLTLEAPGRWLEMETLCISAWIKDAVATLSTRAKMLFEIECADRIFLYTGPDDVQLRAWLAVWSLFAAGQATAAAWKDAKSRLVNSGAWNSHTNEANGSAKVVASRAIGWSPRDKGQVDLTSPAYQAAELAEQRWQWHRLQEYLRGEAR